MVLRYSADMWDENKRKKRLVGDCSDGAFEVSPKYYYSRNMESGH